MSKLSVALVGMALSCVGMATETQAAAGRTAGTVDVSPFGAATYSIPIWTPPGPKGIQPKLSLTYSSQQGNGVLGLGWSLIGLSAIELCARNAAQDATYSTRPDRYCLDGERLRQTSGANYGDANSTYQTERADFSRITQNSSGTTSYFVVRGKDGLIYEYGNSTDSRLLRGNPVVAAKWLLNKVSDRAGNSYIIQYSAVQSDTVADVVPIKLSWGPTSAGATTYNYTASLAYTQRTAPDIIVGSFAGGDVKNTNRLSSITIKNGAAVVRHYSLGYEQSPSSSLSRLKLVTECADAAMTNCLAPTSVSYFNSTAGIAGTVNTAVASVTKFISADDFSGDGRTDLLYISGTSLYLALGTSGGFAAPQSLGTAPTGTILVGDMVGSGKKDMLAAANGYWYRYYYANGVWNAVSTGLAVETDKAACNLADVNGDGKPDLILAKAGGAATCTHNPSTDNGTASVYARFNTSTNGVASFAPTNQLVASTSVGGQGGGKVFDFYGDGINAVSLLTASTECARFACFTNYYDNFYRWNGTSFVSLAVSAGYGVKLRWNDDQCEDYAGQISPSSVAINIAACNGAVASKITLTLSVALGKVDWNGDGRDDLIINKGGNIAIYVSTGASVASLINTGIPATPVVTATDIDGDGLQDLVLASTAANSPIKYVLHNDAQSQSGTPDLVSGIVDGYGVSQYFSYATLSDNSIYSPGSGGGIPYPGATGQFERETRTPLDQPLWVVKSLTQVDGTGSTYQRLYHYQGARDLVIVAVYIVSQGNLRPITQALRGFEGFESITVSDSRFNMPVIKTSYEHTFPYTGMVLKQDVFQHNGTTLISHTVNTLSAITLDNTAYNQRYFPYISSSTTDTYEVGGIKNGALIKQSSSSFTYDNYGNATTSTTTVMDKDSTAPQSPTYNQSWTTTITNTLTPDAGTNWCLNIPTQTVVSKTSTVSGESAVTRTVAFTPDYARCRVTQQIVEPGSSAYKVTTTFGYDGFGNVNAQTVTGINMTPRTTTANWGTTGQFLTSLTNPLMQTTTFSYDLNLGLPTSATDPNNIRVSLSAYDAFGRKTRETAADGTYTTFSYNDCASVGGGCQNGDPASGATSINEMVVIATQYTTSNIAVRDDWTYLDQFDRPIVTKSKTLAGGYSRVGTQYDIYGNVARTTAPCDAASCSMYWVTNTYDALNRPTQQQRPISASNSALQTTTIAYQGMTTITTDPQSKQKVTMMDPNGWLRRSQDHNGYYQTFGYDAFGSLKGVTDSLSHTLFSANYVYGAGAFQTGTTDIDRGSWGFVPNALGEIGTYTDAKGSTFTQHFDPLSRMTDRSVAGEGTTTWTWGNTAASYNIGRLQNLVSTGGTSETYTYDNKGRLINRDIVSDISYDYDYTYNATTGLLDSLTYPISTSGYRLKLQYVYQNGIQSQVKDFNAGTVYWQANTANPRGQLTKETFGNGVVRNRAFDSVTGWLNSIQAGVGGGTGIQNESYLFDKVGNVIQRQNNTLGLTESFFYDNVYRLDYSQLNGVANLNMTYDAMGRITNRSDVSANAAWTYDTAHIHQVRQAGSASLTYTYDANGNAITRNGFGIAWSKYNYPASIAGLNETVVLSYNANQQRWKQVYTNGGTAIGSPTVETTYYVGNELEKVITGSTTDYRHYIYANGRTAVAVVSRASNGTNTTRYVLGDQQDSIAKITSSSGAVTLSESFTAFGSRRNPSTWSGTPNASDLATSSAITRQGYTWQTALGNLGLNHMNGRVQDTVTGNFLSVDPYISDPTNTQNYNRYVYVYNNPLSLIDPTGFACHSIPIYVPEEIHMFRQGIVEIISSGYYIDMQICLPDIETYINIPTPSIQDLMKGLPINCDTPLPNRQTVGDVVRQQRKALAEAIDQGLVSAQAGYPDASTPLSDFYQVARPNGPIDFKNNFYGQGDPQALGEAGNFAYYAIGSGYIPNDLLDVGAGAYALSAAAKGQKPFSDLQGRMFSDRSADAMRTPGLSAKGCQK